MTTLRNKTDRSQRKIRNYLISPPEQIKFAMYTVLTLGCGMLILGFYFYIYASNLRILFIQAGGDGEALREMNRQAVIYFFLTSVVLILVYSSLSIIYTHRIFGSLHAIEKYLKAILEGQTDVEINSRKGDLTQNIVSVVRRAGEKLIEFSRKS